MKQTHSAIQNKAKALSKLDQNLTFQIAYLARILEIDGTNKLVSSSLKLTDYRILMAIDLFNQITSAELNRVLLIDPAQISRTITNLNKQHLVTISADSTNKRIKWLSLDTRGKQLLNNVKPLFEARQNDIENSLTQTELSVLQSVINKLVRKFE